MYRSRRERFPVGSQTRELARALEIMELETTLTIVIPTITLILGFFLGKWRDNSSVIFNKKLEIYSEIVYELNSASFLFKNVRANFQKTSDKINSIKSTYENQKTTKDPAITKKLMEQEESIRDLDYELKKNDIRDSLIKILAPARLLGNKKIVEKVREYFDLVTEFEKGGSVKDQELSGCVMELEQLMRSDLIGFWNRDLTSLDIKNHLKNDS